MNPFRSGPETARQGGIIPDPREPRTAFRTRGLTKVYRTGEVEVHALRGVDLDLFEGELVVLLGPSGSGKSTLLNILGGLDSPTGGRVFFHDDELTAFDDRALTRYRREHVGFVFQFYNLMPSLTARENVALVTEIARDPMTPEEALTLVGLDRRMDHFPAQMSGGEQQRIDLTSPPREWAALGHGYRVVTRIVTWRGEDVIGVPIGAVFRPTAGRDDWAVYVVDADGRARLRPVTLGRFTDRAVEVTAGLEPGEAVVLHPSDRIEDGARVVRRAETIG